MAEVIMPKMGDAMTEGRVLRWLKQPGDAVARGEPIAEIETDKVNIEIEAEWDGTLAKIVVPEGETAEVGATIALIARPGEAPREETVEIAPPAKPEEGPEEGVVRASPLARRLARERGLSLRAIEGTGPGGRITRSDVEAAGEDTARQAETAVRAPSGKAVDQPLSRMRQTIARRMTESKQQAPHFYLTVSIVMEAALELRDRLNADLADEERVSVNDLVVRASALALAAHPQINASLEGSSVRLHGDVNISVAVALPEGLIVPTLYGCDRKPLLQIARESRALVERARGGRLKPEDLTGGTFTVSNLGMYDVETFIAILNPPQAAILAVGAAAQRAVVRGGEIVAGAVMQATLSADHRVTDGAQAAAFLRDVKRLLENPIWLVAERGGNG